ncbi:MAG: metallophosphoesterase [Alphaproteobacteria bacterium]|nr:metallophosphoesterase [Alphaproteobacteria bacterium]MCB9791444.1 metallophosphoesterase [Alphaproteobacteria bacterium]
MGEQVWGRKVARLPATGTLLVCTDLHGNWGDYQAMRAIYEAEEAAGNQPVLAITGDLVHGPSEDLLEPGMWPNYLGTPYPDQSVELILDFEAWTREARVFSLMGNHEHAHVGGARVPKFHPDEAAVLEDALGPEDRVRMRDFIASFPLVAVSPSGVVLTHAAPRATEARLEDFESLEYRGYESLRPLHMVDQGTVGALLWARFATEAQARRLLAATALGDTPNAFVAFGHDVVPSGFERFSPSQICVSTSFGLYDEHKRYLRLDLSARYADAQALREGVEILHLYGGNPG